MKKQLFVLSTLCLLLTSCENTTTHSNGTVPDADNTARNVRDRNATLTAGEQPENEADRTLTQKIRQLVVDDENLSTNAKNIKIITVNGIVTLRGPVNNEKERIDIEAKAKSVNGVRTVDNLIEIIQNQNN